MSTRLAVQIFQWTTYAILNSCACSSPSSISLALSAPARSHFCKMTLSVLTTCMTCTMSWPTNRPTDWPSGQPADINSFWYLMDFVLYCCVCSIKKENSSSAAAIATWGITLYTKRTFSEHERELLAAQVHLNSSLHWTTQTVPLNWSVIHCSLWIRRMHIQCTLFINGSMGIVVHELVN